MEYVTQKDTWEWVDQKFLDTTPSLEGKWLNLQQEKNMVLTWAGQATDDDMGSADRCHLIRCSCC